MLAHCGRGQEAIIGDRHHVYTAEAGNIAQLGGIVPRILRMNERGNGVQIWNAPGAVLLGFSAGRS